MQIGSTEALKAQMEKCIVSDCKDCPYTDAQICDTAMTKDALEYIESLEERIAIMQESMETLENREPVRHGHWVKVSGYITPGGDPLWKCSECGKGLHLYGVEHGSYGSDVADSQWVACPNCGAVMSEVSE